jgi:hypothetical protein
MELIVINGNPVHCFGEFTETSNVAVLGFYTEGEEDFEGIWAGSENDPSTWQELGDELAPWAERIGLQIEELQAD